MTRRKALIPLQGVAASNRERRNKWEFKNWSYDLGYLVGVYLGDGNVYLVENQTGYFRLSSIDKDFCSAVQKKILSLTGYNSSIHWYESRRQWVLSFCNSDFARWLVKTFGRAKKKRIKTLPSLEANKGLIEGIFDSESTVIKYTTIVRMKGNLDPIRKVLKEQFKIRIGDKNISMKSRACSIINGDRLDRISISCKEYTRMGLGSYIKRKAINGILYKK
jgi:hypothetical protein